MRKIVATGIIAGVLAATAIGHVRAQTAPPAPVVSQWALTLIMPNAVWVPGVYPTEEKCELARRRTKLRKLVCVEILAP